MLLSDISGSILRGRLRLQSFFTKWRNHGFYVIFYAYNIQENVFCKYVDCRGFTDFTTSSIFLCIDYITSFNCRVYELN